MKTETTAPILAWHFLPADGKTRYSQETVAVGGTLEATGKLILCTNGLHASRKILDALGYAPGLIVCRVEISGEVVEGDDKLCGQQRRCLAMGNIRKPVLHALADCWARLFERINLADLPWRPVEQAIRDYADEKILQLRCGDFLVSIVANRLLHRPPWQIVAAYPLEQPYPKVGHCEEYCLAGVAHRHTPTLPTAQFVIAFDDLAGDFHTANEQPRRIAQRIQHLARGV